MSIADKLTRLATARNNIITAIIAKGVQATGHGFEDFATDIGQISGGGGTYQQKTVTPTAAGFEVTPDSGYDALEKVILNGDAELIAANVRKNVEIFGVTGTLEEHVPGSLIVCTCSTNITSVDVLYGSASQTGVYMAGNVAYAVIPYTYTGSVTVRGHYIDAATSEQRTTEAYVTVTDIKEYDCSLYATSILYNAGTWYGVGTHGWNSESGSSVTEGASSIQFTVGHTSTYYWYGSALDVMVSSRGYSGIKYYYNTIGSDHNGLSCGYNTREVPYAYPYFQTVSSPYYNNYDNYTAYSDFDTENKTVEVDIASGTSQVRIAVIGTIEITKIELV